MEREIVDALIASLNDPGAGWQFNQYRAWNNRIECEIWLANGHEFLEVKFTGPKIGPSKGPWRAMVKYGGDALVFGFLVPWRRRLYRAARERQMEAIARPRVAASTIVAAIRSASEVPA